MTQNEPHFGRNTDTFWAADWGPRPYARYFEVVLACHKLSVPGSTICKPQVSLQRVSECWNQLFSQIDPKLCGRPTALVRGAFVKDFFPPVLGHSPEALGEALQKPWSCLLASSCSDVRRRLRQPPRCPPHRRHRSPHAQRSRITAPAMRTTTHLQRHLHRSLLLCSSAAVVRIDGMPV